MAVPKRKVSKSKKRMRKASHRKDPLQLRVDKETHSVHRSHCVDPKTGRYRGRQVVAVTVSE